MFDNEEVTIMNVRYATALINDWNKYQFNGRIKTNLVIRAEAFMKGNYQNNTHYAQHRDRILEEIRVKKFRIRQRILFIPMLVA